MYEYVYVYVCRVLCVCVESVRGVCAESVCVGCAFCVLVLVCNAWCVVSVGLCVVSVVCCGVLCVACVARLGTRKKNVCRFKTSPVRIINCASLVPLGMKWAALCWKWVTCLCLVVLLVVFGCVSMR